MSPQKPEKSSTRAGTRPFVPLPAGAYPVRIADVTVLTSQAGNPWLSLRYTVSEGPHAGRCVFDGLHLWHRQSDTARRVAAQKLQSILRAAGLTHPEALQDSTELLGLEMEICVFVRQGPNGLPRNEIRLYRPRSSSPSHTAGLVRCS